VAWKASGTAIVYVNAAARSVSDGPSLPPPPAAPPRTPGSCSSASPAIERGLAYFKRIASVLAKAALGLRLNEHITADSPTVFAHACKMGLEGTAMSSDRLNVSVTFDAERGYIASAPELHQPIVALSLGGLRRRIEMAMLPDNVRVVLQLDGLAERERDRLRAQAQLPTR
jgi:hypothetical protein